MLSITIKDDEVKKICQKKFRAESAIALTNDGKGIGMNRVLKTLKLNNAKLEIKPRVTNQSTLHKDIYYDNNQFIIEFDKTRLI